MFALPFLKLFGTAALKTKPRDEEGRSLCCRDNSSLFSFRGPSVFAFPPSCDFGAFALWLFHLNLVAWDCFWYCFFFNDEYVCASMHVFYKLWILSVWMSLKALPCTSSERVYTVQTAPSQTAVGVQFSRLWMHRERSLSASFHNEESLCSSDDGCWVKTRLTADAV